MGRFDRLQSQVERLEARVRSYEVGGPVPPAWIDDAENSDPAVEAELAKMKESLGSATAEPEAAAEAPAEAEKKAAETASDEG